MPKAMIAALLSTGRGRHGTIIGRFPHGTQLLENDGKGPSEVMTTRAATF
jgi:hypothetical protein